MRMMTWRAQSIDPYQNWLNAVPVPRPLSRKIALSGWMRSDGPPDRSSKIAVGSRKVLATNTPLGRAFHQFHFHCVDEWPGQRRGCSEYVRVRK